MAVAEVNVCNWEERNLGESAGRNNTTHCKPRFPNLILFVPDYKSNLLREKAHLSPQPKVIDLDKGSRPATPCWLFLKAREN